MTTIKASFGHPDFSDAQLRESVADILSRNELGALATARDGEPHAATVSYAFADDLTLYFISAQTDVHTQDIAVNPSAAVAIWVTPESWGKDLQGLQLFGLCEEVKVGRELLAAMHLYLARFPAFTALLKNPGEFKKGIGSRMFAMRPTRIRLIDEPRFGYRVFIDASITGSRPGTPERRPVLPR